MLRKSNLAPPLVKEQFLAPVSHTKIPIGLARKLEPPRDKTNKMACAPSEDSDQPGWSDSLLSAWRKLGFLATHWAHSEDSDQTGHAILLVLSRGVLLNPMVLFDKIYFESARSTTYMYFYRILVLMCLLLCIYDNKRAFFAVNYMTVFNFSDTYWIMNVMGSCRKRDNVNYASC